MPLKKAILYQATRAWRQMVADIYHWNYLGCYRNTVVFFRVMNYIIPGPRLMIDRVNSLPDHYP